MISSNSNKAKFSYYITQISLVTLLLFLSSKTYEFSAKSETSKVTRTEPLDTLSNNYHQIIFDRGDVADCELIPIEEQEQTNIFYQHCPYKIRMQDGESEKINEHFAVEPYIARKYNFWRRIYSVYSLNQYLVHLAEFPEIVLEVIELKDIENLGPIAQRKLIDKISNKQKRYYRHLFEKLVANKNLDFESMTPAMKRISRLMGHINDPQKYEKAKLSIRVQRGQRDFIKSGLVEFKKYSTEIKKEFEKRGLPSSLAKISFVESSFNIHARSKVGASGVFQIMPETGKQYLTINDHVDERNDPIKASKAAALIFQMNYKLANNDWPLAITAYNHGIGSIKRAMKHTKSSNLETIIEQYDHSSFGFASKNFYAEFLGILGTIKRVHEVFPEVGDVEPIEYTNIKLKKWTTFEHIKKSHNITHEQIKSLNPDISRESYKKGGLPAGFSIKIPAKLSSDEKKSMPSSS